MAHPFLYALKTEQERIAIVNGPARRYPGDVLPFAGIEDSSLSALSALRDLLAPGEAIYLTHRIDALPDSLEEVGRLEGWQMRFDGAVSTTAARRRLRELGAADAQDMIALTDIAFPGYYRPRTYTLGAYYGIHEHGELIAMAGERLAVPGQTEISAVCTHPQHTGKGYAAALVTHLMEAHRARGLQSFLHVSAANERAIALYKRLGFVKSREMLFTQLRATITSCSGPGLRRQGSQGSA